MLSLEDAKYSLLRQLYVLYEVLIEPIYRLIHYVLLCTSTALKDAMAECKEQLSDNESLVWILTVILQPRGMTGTARVWAMGSEV